MREGCSKQKLLITFLQTLICGGSPIFSECIQSLGEAPGVWDCGIQYAGDSHVLHICLFPQNQAPW